MRVAVWPVGALHVDATSLYRLVFPAQALWHQGADVHVDRIGPMVGWDREWHGDLPPLAARIRTVERCDYDVVVIQRPGRAHWTELIPLLQARGVRVIVDVDDDFDAIPRANAAWPEYNQPDSARYGRQWIARACEAADLVTVSTPALARRYGRHGRVAVLPNLVPAHYLTLPALPLHNTVGWAGSVRTHPHDLEVTGGAVADVTRDTGWTVHVVGPGTGAAERFGVQSVSSTGWVPFPAYAWEVARLQVGVVPLHRSPFNDGKSALKLAEFSALGVPTVASPTPDNVRLNALGAGILADAPHRWRRSLSRLVRDPDHRAEVAQRSREAMAGQTYEAQCGRWLDAWTGALRGRRAA